MTKDRTIAKPMPVWATLPLLAALALAPDAGAAVAVAPDGLATEYHHDALRRTASVTNAFGTENAVKTVNVYVLSINNSGKDIK